MGIPDHLTCLLRNLYAGEEATIRTGHGTTGWFQIGKGVHQDYLLSPCLFNFYADYILLGWMAHKLESRLLGYQQLQISDDITLTAESKEELKSLLMRVKEEREKAGLKLNSQKKLRSWHLVPTFHSK